MCVGHIQVFAVCSAAPLIRSSCWKKVRLKSLQSRLRGAGFSQQSINKNRNSEHFSHFKPNQTGRIVHFIIQLILKFIMLHGEIIAAYLVRTFTCIAPLF